MDKEHLGREHIEPRLLSLVDASEEVPWLFIKNLNVGDILEVQTRKTLYTIKVTNPKSGSATINSNGRHVTQEIDGSVLGTTLTGTGTMVKMGGIAIGFRLVLFVNGIGELILSSTQEVRINGFKILPAGHAENVH